MVSVSILAMCAAFIVVRGDDRQSLQEQLLRMAEAQLAPAGLSIDRERVWMSVSRALPPVQSFEVRTSWRMSGDGRPPSLPLTFDLHDAQAGARDRPVQVTLAVSLQREVLVAHRRLRKGSRVTCDDFGVERRDLRTVPKGALSPPCEIEVEQAALRDIVTHDVLRSVDIGPAPDVVAGESVRVNVAAPGVTVTTTAIALADARVGDYIEVRLRRPSRTLKTLVTGRGSVQLTGATP